VAPETAESWGAVQKKRSVASVRAAA
jgi:hypothetical protein